MTKEALRLALEFISSISPAFICEASHHKKHEQHASNELCPHVAKQKQVYEAIKAALEAKDEPVGWAEHGVINWLADKQFRHTSFLYTTPPQRTWVGLTDAEVQTLRYKIDSTAHWTYDEFARAIEAKLRSKND